MKSIGLFTVSASALLSVALSGCATAPPKGGATEALNADQVPASVIVRLDCGECDIPKDVIESIREGYAEASVSAASFSNAASTIITVKEYFDRGFLVSAAIGPLNFFVSDYIKGTVEVGGKQIDIEDSSRVRPPIKFWQMRSLGKSFGKQAFSAK
jgi:hypothetical protein